MPTLNLGRVGMVARGNWVAGTYKYLDVVKHTGGSYMCSVLTTTEEPSGLAIDWQVIATDATAEVIDDPTPQLGGYLDTNGKAILESKGADIASATATAIGNDGNFFDVTGVTTITSFSGTSRVGKRFTLQFDASLILTHNAISLILPTGANITTSAGDIASFVEYSTGNYVCVSYEKSDGTPLNLSFTKTLKLNKGSDIASATALTIGADGNYFDVTGVTTITSIGTTGKVGTVIKLHFDGILVLTHSAIDLILPGGANITTAAGDEAEFIEYASGDFRCTSYTKASGVNIIPDPSKASLSGFSMTGSLNYSRATVASHATTADIWTGGNQIDYTGTATTTAFPNAPQAGAERTLICAGACSFTAGTNMLIDGVASGATVTCAANDTVIVRAVSTTIFKLSRVKYDGTAQVVTASGLSSIPQFVANAITTDERFCPYFNTTQAGVTADLSGTIFYYPIVITENVSVDALSMRVTGAVAGDISMALYASTNGLPSTKLVETATISSSTTGLKEGVVTATNLVAGNTYYLAFLSSTTTVAVAATTASAKSILGQNSASTNLLSFNGFTQTSASFPTTATISAMISQSGIPVIMIRKV